MYFFLFLFLFLQYYISVVVIVKTSIATLIISGNTLIFLDCNMLSELQRRYKIHTYIYNVYVYVFIDINGYSPQSTSCSCKCYFEIYVKFGHTESCFPLLSVNFQWYWVSFSRLPTATNITGVAHTPSFLTGYHWINDVSCIIWRNEIASMKMVPRVPPIPENGLILLYVRSNGRSENGWLLTTS